MSWNNQRKVRTEMNRDSGSEDNQNAGPLVSVVMPVYNGERHIDEAIQSIRNQTFTDFELLIMNDGSTDRSSEIARGHAEQDDRIRFIPLTHGGYTVALNEGIRLARGTWVARLDADDVAAPERFSRQMTVLTEYPTAAAIGSYAQMIGETGRVVGAHRFGPTNLEEFQKIRQEGPVYLIHSSVIFSRQVALNLGGYRKEYEPAEDLDLWSRMADDHLVIVVPEPLVSYRIHSNAVSSGRFRAQMKSARRAGENARRRRVNEAELSAIEYERWERARPLHKRIALELKDRSQQYYRRGGSLLAAGRYQGLGWLALSFFAYPPVPLVRLHRQGVGSNAIRRITNRRLH